MQANRNINSGNSIHYKLSRSKAPKTQQICYYKHTRKTSELFLSYDTGVGFNSRNNFANLGSLAKISVPLQFIIPWYSLYVSCGVVISTSLKGGYIQNKPDLSL